MMSTVYLSLKTADDSTLFLEDEEVGENADSRLFGSLIGADLYLDPKIYGLLSGSEQQGKQGSGRVSAPGTLRGVTEYCQTASDDHSINISFHPK